MKFFLAFILFLSLSAASSLCDEEIPPPQEKAVYSNYCERKFDSQHTTMLMLDFTDKEFMKRVGRNELSFERLGCLLMKFNPILHSCLAGQQLDLGNQNPGSLISNMLLILYGYSNTTNLVCYSAIFLHSQGSVSLHGSD
jgi:hypothetical protein